MALMQWSEYFVTGIELIDNQHQRLVELINSVAPQLAEAGDAPAPNLHPLLNQLADYAALHFSCEEDVMLTAGIDAAYFVHHQQNHALFTQEVTQMIQGVVEGHTISGSNLLRFLSSWLTFHILSEDQCMVRQLRAIQSGTPAEKARLSEKSENSSVNAVLNQALIDLFSLISERNRTLMSLNKQLAQTKSELVQANVLLEARVLERTAELKQANLSQEREHQALSVSLAEVRRSQAQLLQAEKMAAIGQLAAGVAHEINNPIGFVTSNLSSLNDYAERLFGLIDVYQVMANELPADHPARAATARARELAEIDYLRQDIPDLLRESSEGLARVKRIVSDLKDYSQVDASEWQEADINQRLESTLNLLGSQLTGKAEVVRDFTALPRLLCIPAQLNQAFMNLLLNAAQAIETAGVITLRTRRVDDQIRISITDSGQGIPPELQKRIFEPFFTTRPVGKGTGLGLSVAWDIAKRHGGSIDVESVPGKGSTFTLCLPLRNAEKPTDGGGAS